MTFVWCMLGFGKCFAASSQTSHWACCHQFSYKIHFSSHVTVPSRNGPLLLHRIREDNTLKQYFFKIFVQLERNSLIELFHISSLLQMLNDHRMIDTVFLGNFSCSFKRISLDDPLNWSSSTSMLLIFKALVFFQNFLKHHCTVLSLAVPGPNVLLINCEWSPLLYDPFCTWIGKLLEFAFCLTSFP